MQDVEQIASGGFFSLALTKENKVFSWGINEYGQLGIGESSQLSVNQPVIVDFQGTVKNIFAGEDHAVLLTTTGDVFSFGFGLVTL